MEKGIFDYDRDWQVVKDKMTFLATDAEREAILKAAILSHSRL